MEYLVTMTTQIPDGIAEESVAAVRAREAADTRELAAQGRILRLWRPPLEPPGEWHAIGLFAVADHGELEQILASMPLRLWRSDEVTELAHHPHDPVVPAQLPRPAPRETGMEFFTTFILDIPDGTPTQVVSDARAGEARRMHELAGQGHLIRLWVLAAWPDESHALGLWRARDAAHMQTILESLPMAPWLTEQITPVVPHPNDPAVFGSRTGVAPARRS